MDERGYLEMEVGNGLMCQDEEQDKNKAMQKFLYLGIVKTMLLELSAIIKAERLDKT